MIKIRNYVKATSLEEAYELNQKKSNRIIGGMMWIKMQNSNVGTAIDLSGLGLDKIEETEDSYKLGAMVTLRQLELHQGINEMTCGAARECVKDIVGVQFRNTATIGGSVFGRFGFSDILTLLMALDAKVELYKKGIVGIEEFAAMKRDRDILVNVIIPKRNMKVAFKAQRRSKTDFAVLNACAASFDGEYRVCVGARPGKAVLIKDVDGIIEKAGAEGFAEYAKSTVETQSNLRGSAEYRSLLVDTLVKRVLGEVIACR